MARPAEYPVLVISKCAPARFAPAGLGQRELVSHETRDGLETVRRAGQWCRCADKARRRYREGGWSRFG